MTPSTITWRGQVRLCVYGGLQIRPMLAGQYAFLLVGGWFGVQLFLCNCALVRYFVPECFEASREVVVTYGAGAVWKNLPTGSDAATYYGMGNRL